jgi:hypothetical protein
MRLSGSSLRIYVSSRKGVPYIVIPPGTGASVGLWLCIQYIQMGADHRVHKSPPLVPILSQINAFYSTLFCIFKINLNIILPPTCRPP